MQTGYIIKQKKAFPNISLGNCLQKFKTIVRNWELSRQFTMALLQDSIGTQIPTIILNVLNVEEWLILKLETNNFKEKILDNNMF